MCQPSTKHVLHDGSHDYFHEHLTSTYSAPGTFSHALPPKLPSGLRDFSQFSVLQVKRLKLGACGSGIRVMEYPQL